MSADREKRLADAAEFGRRLADETISVFREQMDALEQGRRFFDNRDAAFLILQAQGNSATPDAVMRMVFDAGEARIAPPRPHLVDL